MNPTQNQPPQCIRLRQQVQQDGGTGKLSPTDLAFYQTFCDPDSDPLPHQEAAVLDHEDRIDESAHIPEGTTFGDPDAGRPDDPDDANPATHMPGRSKS